MLQVLTVMNIQLCCPPNLVSHQVELERSTPDTMLPETQQNCLMILGLCPVITQSLRARVLRLRNASPYYSQVISLSSIHVCS